MKEKIRGAIMGGSECGKTSLASSFSLALYRRYKLRSLVFFPWLKEYPHMWGKQAWVTTDFDDFRRVVFSVKNCAVFWDEGTTTGGRDRENLDFFTAIRHKHPAFFFLGHQYAAMLSTMRGSLTDLYLARADPDDADKWARLFTDADVKEAKELNQYEFLHKRSYRKTIILRPTLDELRAGVTP